MPNILWRFIATKCEFLVISIWGTCYGVIMMRCHINLFATVNNRSKNNRYIRRDQPFNLKGWGRLWLFPFAARRSRNNLRDKLSRQEFLSGIKCFQNILSAHVRDRIVSPSPSNLLTELFLGHLNFRWPILIASCPSSSYLYKLGGWAS